jgi:hypothetical protein
VGVLYLGLARSSLLDFRDFRDVLWRFAGGIEGKMPRKGIG